MAEYYLIAQLPSLDAVSDAMPLPISEERFLELCSRFLNKKLWAELSSLSLTPPLEAKKSGVDLVETWNNAERRLRLALAMLRAEKLGKPFNAVNESFSDTVLSVVNSAMDIENPLEAENYLNSYRLGFLESLRPTDTFKSEFLFYYLLKLKLLSRMRCFNRELGKTAYKNIYNSILGGDRVEAK